MFRRVAALLGLLTVACLSGSLGRARAESADWASAAKAFGEQFKLKADLKQRRSAVNALVRSGDARAVDLLLSVVDDQTHHGQKLRKEWQEGEKAWQAKSAAMDKQLSDLEREAKKRGDEKFTYQQDSDLDQWFGLSPKWEGHGKGAAEKERLATLFHSVTDEEGMVDVVLRGATRVLNNLAGDELDRASAHVTDLAGTMKPERRLPFLRALGYAKGDKITAYLETVAREMNPELVQVALEAIGRQNSERGADILIARLEDPRWQVRASAITGLSYYHAGKVVAKVMDALLERAKKEEGVLQRNFFVGMARITQEAVPATVEAWESWWKSNRADFMKKVEAREGAGLPVEDEPKDVLVEQHQGSSSFYGISTNSKHIIWVVDVSGSMAWDAKDPDRHTVAPVGKRRIDIAREELKKAVQGLSSKEGDERGDATFNIVIFSTDVEVFRPGKMVEASKKNKDDAMKWIDEKVVPLGATNIYDALEQAFNIMSASSDAKNLKGGADTIFLMTDGEPNRGKFFDPALIVQEIKKMNATRKITLHTIGVGKDHKADFLQQLAATNGGQYLGR